MVPTSLKKPGTEGGQFFNQKQPMPGLMWAKDREGHARWEGATKDKVLGVTGRPGSNQADESAE